jgi:hypothetical protein
MGSTWDFIRNVAWKDFKALLAMIRKGFGSIFGFIRGKKK